jgi:hypothetical protein
MYETLGMISRWVKKMIPWRKSPKTSYIERSGREDFERNTFEFPARFETKFRSNAGSSDTEEGRHKRARRNLGWVEKSPRKIWREKGPADERGGDG